MVEDKKRPKIGYYSKTAKKDGIFERTKHFFAQSQQHFDIVPIEEIVQDFKNGRRDLAAAKFYVKVTKGRSIFQTGRMHPGMMDFLRELGTEEPFKSMIVERYRHEIDKEKNRAYRMGHELNMVNMLKGKKKLSTKTRRGVRPNPNRKFNFRHSRFVK